MPEDSRGLLSTAGNNPRPGAVSFLNKPPESGTVTVYRIHTAFSRFPSLPFFADKGKYAKLVGE
jgi:hypothetical protein